MRYLKKMNVSNVITAVAILIIMFTAMIDDFEFGWFIIFWLVLFVLSCIWLIRLAIEDDYKCERGAADD